MSHDFDQNLLKILDEFITFLPSFLKYIVREIQEK